MSPWPRFSDLASCKVFQLVLPPPAPPLLWSEMETPSKACPSESNLGEKETNVLLTGTSHPSQMCCVNAPAPSCAPSALTWVSAHLVHSRNAMPLLLPSRVLQCPSSSTRKVRQTAKVPQTLSLNWAHIDSSHEQRQQQQATLAPLPPPSASSLHPNHQNEPDEKGHFCFMSLPKMFSWEKIF